MSKIRSLSLALALTAGAASIGAAQSTTPAPAHRQHVAGDSTGWKRGEHGRGEGMLFRGIDLTDAQKTQLKTIHEKYRSQNAGWRDSAHVADKGRGMRQRGDSAGRPQLSDADRAKFRAQREQQLAEVRAILTPEQRTKFDANVAERQARVGQAQGRRGQRKQG